MPNRGEGGLKTLPNKKKAKMLKAGSTILSIWSGINFLLAALILTSVVIFNANSPLLVMVFKKSEIASLDARVIASGYSLFKGDKK